jgi:hypothetical protein
MFGVKILRTLSLIFGYGINYLKFCFLLFVSYARWHTNIAEISEKPNKILKIMKNILFLSKKCLNL